MKHLAAALLCVTVFSGCLTDPNRKVGDSPSTAAAAVSAKELGEALAQWVESGECETTDEFFKAAERAGKRLGVDVSGLGEAPDRTKIDDTLKSELAAKARSLR